MLRNLWSRMRASWQRQGAELDQARVENAVVEHEEAERERAKPEADLPPGRTNTDWSYINVRH